MAETGTVTFLAIGVAGLTSAACCLASPLAFGAPLPVLMVLLLTWGASVIADSAQFSAAVTELAEPRYAGSVLALQLALGFTLTIVSIRLVPLAAGAVGWRYVLLPLAAGPLLGTIAMQRLRRLPAALRLANGRR
jgi:hypothetical protein